MRRLYGPLIALLSLILMLGVAPAPLQEVGANSEPSAPSSTSTTTNTTTVHHKESEVPTGTQIIWCGLWNGSNFNFTDACAHIGNDDQQTAQAKQQVQVTHTKTVTTPSASASTKTTVSATGTDNDSDNDTNSTSSQTSSVSSSTNETMQSSQPSATVMSQEPTTNTSNTSTSTASAAPSSSEPSSSSATNTSCDSSSTTCGTQTVPTGTAIIWCGLWQGSNFNVTGDCQDVGDNQPTVTLPAADPPSQSSTSSTAPATTTSSDPPATTASADPPASSSGGAYAALGDSVAAGLGLPLPANADSSTTACGRSTEGYPNLIASSMNLSLLNVSCSGTTTGDLLTSENVNGVDQSPQLDQAFAHGTPKFISMTSGANDIEWSFFLKQCYTSNCADTTNTVAVDGLLVALQAKLLAALGSIQARSHGTPPRTVVTGYYQPVSAQCVQMSNGQITSAEVNWIQAATNALNQTIRQTAGQFSFVRYAPVSFAGHDACSSNPWVQMINDPAPFHPTAQGQQAIAKDVEAAMNQ